jgi:hypothetical protein
MSFLITHYYLIEPTPPLITRLQSALEESFASVLLERLVVAKSHQSSLNTVLEQANITEIKLAFLARLLIDRVWDFATQFEDLFGSQELSTSLFDRWWTLSEIECESFSDWAGFVTQAREQSNNASNSK